MRALARAARQRRAAAAEQARQVARNTLDAWPGPILATVRATAQRLACALASEALDRTSRAEALGRLLLTLAQVERTLRSAPVGANPHRARASSGAPAQSRPPAAPLEELEPGHDGAAV